MATAKLKRKSRLSKIESYKAANIKEVQFRHKCCVVAHGYILAPSRSFPSRQRKVRSVLSPRCVRAAAGAARRAVLSPSLYLSGTVCFL